MAVICFPGLEKAIYEPNPYYQENVPAQIKSSPLDQSRSTSSPIPIELDALQRSSCAAAIQKALSKKHVTALTDTSSETEDSEPLYCRRRSYGKSSFKKLNSLNSNTEELRAVELASHIHDADANGLQSEHKTHIQATGRYSCLDLIVRVFQNYFWYFDTNMLLLMYNIVSKIIFYQFVWHHCCYKE